MSTKLDSLIPSNKLNEIIKVLAKNGYTEKSKNGSSHRVFSCNGKQTLSIKNCREVSPGIKRQICKAVFPDYMDK
jgi:predicted RNA binding protein YcfA (HicA-like mRNA interferase family)